MKKDKKIKKDLQALREAIDEGFKDGKGDLDELRSRKWFVFPCTSDSNKFLNENDLVSEADIVSVELFGKPILAYQLPDGYDQMILIAKNWEANNLDLKVFHQKPEKDFAKRTDRFIFMSRREILARLP